VARVLLVGCGCRGGELAKALLERGHAVRGTTRDESRFEAIAAAGAEAALADPDRLMTLMPHVEGVSVLCWLMGSASPLARMSVLVGMVPHLSYCRVIPRL